MASQCCDSAPHVGVDMMCMEGIIMHNGPAVWRACIEFLCSSVIMEVSLYNYYDCYYRYNNIIVIGPLCIL